jgi:large subunit ribosomal protein L29
MPTATELRELDDDELDTRLAEYRRELLNLRFQMATGQLDNYARLNAARRDVARVMTVLRDREIALAEGRDAGPVILERPVRPARRRGRPQDEEGLAEETDEAAVHEAEDVGDEVDDEVVAEVEGDDASAGDEEGAQ